MPILARSFNTGVIHFFLQSITSFQITYDNNCEQLYFSVTILITNNLHTVILFEIFQILMILKEIYLTPMGTLTGNIILIQSGPRCNGNEMVTPHSPDPHH